MSRRPGAGSSLRAGALLAGVAVLLVGCGGESDADGGAETAVTQSGDTTIVVPALDGPVGRMVSDLVIGDDESNVDAVFGSTADAAFDAAGRIYVVDGQASRVSVFSADGAFERVVARRGDGPGEIDFPRYVRIGPDGTVAVASGGEVEAFGPDGERVGTFRPPGHIRGTVRLDDSGLLRMQTGPIGVGPHAPWQVPAGGVAAVEISRSATTNPFSIRAFELDGVEVESSVAPFGLDDLGCIAPDPGAPNARVCIGFTYSTFPFVDWLPDGRLVLGHTDRYRLDIAAGPEGGGPTSIRPDRPRLAVEGALDAFIRGDWIPSESPGPFDSLAEPPTRKPAIARLMPTRDGTIWVRVHAESERTTDDDGEEDWVEIESRFDIFTPDGAHVGHVTGPADLLLRDVRGDTLLTTRTGVFDIPIVERFIIDWSDPN